MSNDLLATRESGCQLRAGVATYCWMTHRRIIMQVHLKCHGFLGGKVDSDINLFQDRMLISYGLHGSRFMNS